MKENENLKMKEEIMNSNSKYNLLKEECQKIMI